MKHLIPMLKNFGLSDNEAKVFIALASFGDSRASEIAKNTNVPRSKIYEIIKNLHKKGFAEILPEKIVKFRAVSFEKVSQLLMEDREKEIKSLAADGKKISEYIAGMTNNNTIKEDGIGQFVVYKTKKMIRKKIEEMVSTKEKSIFMAIRPIELKEINYMKKYIKKNGIRILTHIEGENLNFIKDWSRISELNHTDTYMPARFVIKDGSEVLVFQTTPVALYSKDPRFVELMKNFETILWDNSVNGEKKIKSIESGVPVEKTEVMRGWKNVFSEITEMVKSSEKNLILCVTSFGMKTALEKRKCLLEETKKRGVRIRYIAPLNKSNIKHAKKLSKLVELRHYDIPIRFLMNDNTCIFTSKVVKGYPDEMIKSTVPELVARVRDMIENIWDISIPAELKIREIETGTSIETTKIIYDNEIEKRQEQSFAETKKEICVIVPAACMKTEMCELGSLKINDAKKLAKKGIKIKIITNIAENNLEAAKRWVNIAEIRHAKIKAPVCLEIFDERECISIHECMDMNNKMFPRNIATWSNMRSEIIFMRSYFSALWEDAIPFSERINELKGMPSDKIDFLRGRENLYKLLPQIIDSTEKDILVLLTPHGASRIFGFLMNNINDAIKRGVKIRCMIHINKENLGLIKKLNMAEIRHTDKSPVAMACFDDKKAMIINVKEDTNSMDSDDTAIIISSKPIVEIKRRMLEEKWKKAVPIEERADDIRSFVLMEKESAKKIR